MQIISHRGYWKSEEEKNTEIAFRRSFELGFGTETDIRDYMGELVISHDIADKNSLAAEELFKIYSSYNKDLPLALNIKADGLQLKLKELLEKYKVNNYFVFDMSVPDGLVYLRHGLNSYTRQSEYEQEPSFYDEAAGIWLDEFHSHWIENYLIEKHLKKGKDVCIVSPDLHRRSFDLEWKQYKEIKDKKFILCTDFPEKAEEYFCG